MRSKWVTKEDSRVPGSIKKWFGMSDLHKSFLQGGLSETGMIGLR